MLDVAFIPPSVAISDVWYCLLWSYTTTGFVQLLTQPAAYVWDAVSRLRCSATACAH